MLFRNLRSFVWSVFAGLALANVGLAGSPTDNANNSYEYNTYVYTYNARSMVLNMPTAIQNQYDKTTSINERTQLSSEKFFAELLNIHVGAAFDHAYDALIDSDHSQWSACLQDLNSAIYACEDLLNFQRSMSRPSRARMQAVRSCKFYLETAADNCLAASWTWIFAQPVIIGWQP